MKLTAPTLTVAAGLPFALVVPPAIAQETPVTVRLEHDDDDSIINLGDTVTWTLSIAFTTEAGLAASGMNATLLADNTLGTSSDFAYTTTFDDTGFGFNGGTNGGDSNGAGIEFINFTNSILLEFEWWHAAPASKSNPLLVGTFEFTAASIGTLDYQFATGPAQMSFLFIDVNAFSQNLFDHEDVAFEIDTLTIVPSPATTLPLAALALVTTRRRR